ncbi:unnamed protein product [Strongylus vulgaris]|uniref:PPPDE domain-containing protein n=1 Tax=Strongylus vulgaris TaxID=40348 RepID=A0A3P7J0M2_STRVU|nr:unnamed protein product [Strongylus vulgaris]
MELYWLNDYASNIGFGIFHSGIEVYGYISWVSEYAYGGHPYAFSGVFENSPQDAEELGENFKFKQSIVIGETEITAAGVRELIKALGQEYRGDRYHLISRNCNHFSAVLAKVNSRATVVSARGFICAEGSSPPSSGPDSRSGSPPSIQRIWAQIKSTMAGDIRP